MAAGVSSPAHESGVMTLSLGSMEVDTGVTAAKREGYNSPGMDKNDSAGEVSNLTSGAGVVGSSEA